MIQIQATSILDVKEHKGMQRETFSLGNQKIIIDEKYEKKMTKVIDELGLDGQKKLILSDQKSLIIPFPKMNNYEQKMWGTFAPVKHKLQEYSDNIIPVEVLEIIKLIKNKDYFQDYEIWGETREEIDPILVGIRKKIQNGEEIKYSSDYEKYLIARRGYALQPFQDIVDRVKESFIKKRKEKIEEAKEKLAYLSTQVNKDFESRSKQNWRSSDNYSINIHPFE